MAMIAANQKIISEMTAKILGPDERKPEPALVDSGSKTIAEGDSMPGIQTAIAARDPVVTIDQAIQSEIEQYLSGRPGIFGVAVRSVDTGQTALINEKSEFPSASTCKLLVMYKVYQQMEREMPDTNDLLLITWADAAEDDLEGGLYSGQTISVADALEAMITVSSNSAAYALTRLVGGWGAIDAAADELGVRQTGQQVNYFVITPGICSAQLSF